MGRIFKDHQHDEFGPCALGDPPYGGADFGAIAAIANQVGEGGDVSF
jgi:hypothetical protein